ncbi:MAG TPA: hypothetical protein VG406_11185 [Isosphaeraceae bacterium]|jgi:hypothetical protein|nr:hypothetical protein [Isosphaeraceae bacterium]
MVHFTCDLCGKDLSATGDRRYVVKIAAYAGFDPNEIRDEDLDDDHMEAVAELLRQDEQLGAGELDAQPFKGFRFDLCPSCHSKYLKDPLGKDPIRMLDFSEN